MTEPATLVKEATARLVLALDEKECPDGVCEAVFLALVQLVAVVIGHEANKILGKHVIHNGGSKYRLSNGTAESVLILMYQSEIT